VSDVFHRTVPGGGSFCSGGFIPLKRFSSGKFFPAVFRSSAGLVLGNHHEFPSHLRKPCFELGFALEKRQGNYFCSNSFRRSLGAEGQLHSLQGLYIWSHHFNAGSSSFPCFPFAPLLVGRCNSPVLKTLHRPVVSL